MDESTIYLWDSWDGATMYGAGTPEDLGIGLAEAEVAGGLLPGLTVLGGIVVGSAAIYGAYQIGTSIRHMIYSNGSSSSNGTVLHAIWSYSNYTGCPGGGNCWEMLGSGSTSPTLNSTMSGWTDGSANGAYCGPGGGCSGQPSVAGVITFFNAAKTSLGSSATEVCGPTGGITSGYCKLFRTTAQMAAGTVQKPCSSSCYSGAQPGGTQTPTFTQPGSCDSTCLAAVLAALNAVTGTPNVQQRAAIDFVKHGVDPTYPSSDLFAPLVNETYSAYQARLVAAGWLGSITDVPETIALPGYGPLSPTRVSYPNPGVTGPGTIVLDPAAWPGPGALPHLPSGTGLTVRYNPSTAPPLPTTGTPTAVDPTGGGPNAGGGAGSGCTPPTVPAVDFMPLNGHALSGKFPFAIFSWLSGIVTSLNTTGVAPTFTIPIDLSVPIVGTVHKTLPVDLSSANAMMTYLRPILAGFTALGAIIFLTSGALGWGARAPTPTGE